MSDPEKDGSIKGKVGRVSENTRRETAQVQMNEDKETECLDHN